MTDRTAITGGAGFLGSHVVDFFVEKGEDVVVVDDFSDGRRENLVNSQDRVEVREVDLTDRKAAIAALANVDYVVHLAAKIGGIGYFHDVPADIISLNDAMNRSVFDAARENDIDRVVYASSSMVYERASEFPVSEDTLDEVPPPESAYGFQKLAGEYYARAYHDQYGVEYSIFRPFNAIGPREPPGDEVGQAHVVPDFVKKILEERQYPLEILGSGEQIRAFTNVSDIASGIHRCTFDAAAANDDFNLGSEEGIRMSDLAERLWSLCGRDREIAFDHEEGFAHDVKRRLPDSSKARRKLGWEPSESLDDSLEEYVAWYEEAVL